MRVFVLSHDKQPLMPCRPARARKLLCSGKAAVFRQYPFTIILKERTHGDTQPISLNIDPGSKTTGVSLVATFKRGNTAVVGIHIEHRGHQIKEALDSRRLIRRTRRNRKTRYRAPRFNNRRRAEGWLPPSLLSRVYNLETWVRRLSSLAPLSSAQVETVRFDMQIMENPSITGAEYQQGTLHGWEIREYLLYRHKHTCAYCDGLSRDPILEKEHIHPRCLHGTDRLSNLVLACKCCNADKGSLHPKVWAEQCEHRKNKLEQTRARNMVRILAGYRPILKDAAAVNATRYAVGRVTKAIIPNTTFCSGGRTKKNRSDQGYSKDHWIDAACVGETGSCVRLEATCPLNIAAKGHGSRQMCRMDRFGFPRTSAKASERPNIQDRRYRCRSGAHWQKNWALCWPCRRASQRIVQYHDAGRRRSRDQLPTLPHPASKRWVRLQTTKDSISKTKRKREHGRLMAVRYPSLA